MPLKNKRTPPGAAAPDVIQWTVTRLIGAGYGLFSRKAASPRWPEFFITALVLKKYRGVSSFWFMIVNAMRGMKEHQTPQGETKRTLAHLIGSKPRDLFRLSGIYRALAVEKGHAIATAAIIEIVRITNERRRNKQKKGKKRSKYESNTHPPRGRRVRAQDRRVAGTKARRARDSH